MSHNGFYLIHDRLQAESPSEQIDFDFLEKISIGKDNHQNLYDFLHGYCDIFAICLHQRYNYPIEAVFTDDGKLVHCYCLKSTTNVDGTKQRNFLDIRGKTSSHEEFLSEFEDWVDIDSFPFQNSKHNLSEEDLRKYHSPDVLEEILSFSKEIVEKYNFWDD